MHVCFTISSVSLIYLNVTNSIPSEYLPHKWKYVIGWNLSVFPYKLLSLILKILTSLTTIACHQQQSAHHLHNSVSYSTFLLRARHASKKVTPYHISCAILRIQIFVATPRSRRVLMLHTPEASQSLILSSKYKHIILISRCSSHRHLSDITSQHNHTNCLHKIPLSIPQIHHIRALFYKLHAEVPRECFRV